MKNMWIAALLLASACAMKEDYKPETYFNATEKDQLINHLARYASKPPKGVTGDQKFSKEFDSFYQEQSSKLRLEQVSRDDDYYYFLLSQPAPSVKEKRNATGGRFKLNDSKEIVEYEEIFRTWKMEPDTLRRRSLMLFEKMVRKQSLHAWYPAVTGDQYIEFPDQRTFFDVAAGEWRTE